MRQFHRPARLDPEVAESIEGAADVAATSELAHRTAQLLVGAGDAASASPARLSAAAAAQPPAGASPAANAAPVRARLSSTASPTHPAPAVAPTTGPVSTLTAGEEPLAVTRAGVVAVAAQGVDEVAELWADSPAGTLPGTLWRLFLLREWLRRDLDLVSRRYATVVDLSRQAEDAPERARLRTALAGARRAPAPEQVREQSDTVLRGQAQGVRALAPVCLLAAGFLRALAAGSQDTWIDDDTDDLADHVTRRDSALLRTAQELADAARRAQAGTLS